MSIIRPTQQVVESFSLSNDKVLLPHSGTEPRIPQSVSLQWFALRIQEWCLSISTILLSALLFNSISTPFNPPPIPLRKPDQLPHNVLLSTIWRAISVRSVTQQSLLCEWDEVYCNSGRIVGTAGFKSLYREEMYWHKQLKWRHFLLKIPRKVWLSASTCAASLQTLVRNVNTSQHF